MRDGVERLRAMPGVVEARAPPAASRSRAATGCRFVIVGPAARRRAIPRRRRMDDRVARLLRGVQDPGEARADVQRARRQPRARRWSIINEAMARRYWPKGDPLNDRLVIGRGVMREFAGETERQIIGVVGDTRDGGLNSDPQPQMYIPQAQVPDAANALNVRLRRWRGSSGRACEPHAVSAAVQEQLRQATGLPVSDVRTMDEVVSRLDLAPAVQHVADDGVRRVGAAARRDRHLRSDGVLGGAAHAGDRHPPARSARRGAAGEEHGRRSRGCGWRSSAWSLAWRRRSASPRLIATFLFGVTARDPLVFVGVPVAADGGRVRGRLAARACAASRVDPIIALRTE